MFPMDFQVPPTDWVTPKSREVAWIFTWRWLGQVGLGRRQINVPGPGDQGGKGPARHPLSHPGVRQVNEVVFSPSESHCATCGEDGSVRVWSLASMELVIQFQVLNQVGWEF